MQATGRLNRRFVKIGLIALIVCILTSSFAYSSLMHSVTIPTNGTVEVTGTMALSGSVLDIQAAIDEVAASGGGTVIIPAGNFSFNLFDGYFDGSRWIGITVPGGVNLVGAGDNQTILYCNTSCWRSGGEAQYCDTLVKMVGSNNRPIRLSGILFQGSVNYSSTLISTYGSEPASNDGGGLVGVWEFGVTNFRIDHCTFLDFSSKAIYATSKQVLSYAPREGNCGIIDHCVIDNPYKDIYWNITGYYPLWAYGIVVEGSGWVDHRWRSLDELFGQYGPDIVYIEDSSFQRCRHCIAASGQGSDAYYVVRYCTFKDNVREYYASFIDLHPGARGFEAYNNVFIDVACDYRSTTSDYWGKFMNRATTCDSGSGLFYDNVIYNCASGVNLRTVQALNETWRVNGWWIWNNVYNVEGKIVSVSTGDSPFDITEEAEYFLHSPSDELGFVYTPYAYPHPLTLST
ncbi:MAG: hypothetical protein ACQCN3_04740 [Candidatus Bathyarchaeia archaeon]|jgi:hypothetical protein